MLRAFTLSQDQTQNYKLKININFIFNKFSKQIKFYLLFLCNLGFKHIKYSLTARTFISFTQLSTVT